MGLALGLELGLRRGRAWRVACGVWRVARGAWRVAQMMAGLAEHGSTSMPPLELEPCSGFEGEVKWSKLFSWTLWLYGGIFGLGTMAGEIEKPEVVFPKAIAILIPTLATVYCLPFAVSISMDPQTQNFEAGHFSTLAFELGGDWMKWLLFVGSLACFVGLYLLRRTCIGTEPHNLHLMLGLMFL